MSGAPGVRLSARASRLLARGQVWFYADDLAETLAEDGDVVAVLDAAGQRRGVGFYSARSRIRLRLCAGGPADEPAVAEGVMRARLDGALRRRRAWLGPTAGVRLAHADADGLPGLTIDVYADCVVLQATTSAADRHVDVVVDWLRSELDPRMVLARNDLSVRVLEGLPREVRLLHGRRVERVEIEEDGVVHEVDPWKGHKTGFYLDQRPARRRVREVAQGAAVLDLFGYQGAFSLAALAGGARRALVVDQSREALARAERGAERNRLKGLETRRANAFDLLRAMAGQGPAWDLVVVDPPPFAHDRRARQGALRGYRELNRRALRVLAPGGVLVTCSCSHHVSLPMFEDVLRQAAVGLPFRVVLRERIMAGPDHPVWVGLPASEYLRVLVAQRADGDRPWP